MALSSISPLSIKSLNFCSSSSKGPYQLHALSKPLWVACQISSKTESEGQFPGPYAKLKNWRVFVSTALAAAVVASCSSNISALADLNKYEAETRGEFGIGSAAQFGSADLRKAVHVKENFRRANFTSADMRESDFSGSKFNGAYLEKAVAYKANFTGTLIATEH
ncbi:hypothetical protein WN943_013793 [Citrus x changshan-huyou]